MYFRIILVSFLLTGTLLIAQTNPIQVLQDNTAFTVHSKGLPENFRLFISDTVSQILYNPSRGADYQKSFLLTTYLPSNSSTIMAASLFNFMGSRWLFTFSNAITQAHQTNFTHNETEDFSSFPNYYINFDNSSADDINKNINTKFKICTIGKADFGNYSIGLYGLINFYRSSSEDHSNESDSSYYIYSDFNNRTSRNSEGKSSSLNKTASYQAGAEITFSGNEWDLKFNLGYQNSVSNSYLNSNIISHSFNSYYYTFDTVHTTDRTLNNSNFNSDFHPGFIIFNIAAHHNVSFITALDNVFLTVNSYYTSSRFNKSTEISNNYWYSNSEPTNAYNKESLNDPADIWGINLKAGYVVNKSFDDFNLLSGLTIAYSNSRDIEYDTNSMSEIIPVKSIAAVFTLPLYLDYHITKWISFFGGINYYCYYSNYSLKNQGTTISQSFNSYYFRTDKDNYLGVEFLHKSGLMLQLAFQDDMANYKNWDLTVGYKF